MKLLLFALIGGVFCQVVQAECFEIHGLTSESSIKSRWIAGKINSPVLICREGDKIYIKYKSLQFEGTTKARHHSG